MKSARGSDRLRALVERGVITKAMFEAWSGLRNASAHAAINPDSHDTQELWCQCNTVVTMLNRLVFAAVGYAGTYVDYATPGWPDKIFTPPAVTATPGTPPDT